MKRKHRNGQTSWLTNSRLKLFALSAASTLTVINAKSAAGETWAIVGDSISAGAVTRPELQLDYIKIWRIFRGEENYPQTIEHVRSLIPSGKVIPSADPLVLPESIRGFAGPVDWVGQSLLHAMMASTVDEPRLAWESFLAGRWAETGVAPEILIAARDGARAAHARGQLDRVLDFTRGRLPRRIFIFFTGNDLCGPSVEFITEEDDFAASVTGAIRYLVRNGRATLDPTTPEVDVYVVGFLGINQLVFSEPLLNKKVVAHGKEVSCRDLHTPDHGLKRISREERTYFTNNPEAEYFAPLVPMPPAGLCPTMFGPSKQNTAATAIGNRLRLYRQKTQAAVATLQREMAKDKTSRINLHYLSGTENLVFAPEDIANDCMHLSIAGQAKVADVVFTDIQKN